MEKPKCTKCFEGTIEVQDGAMTDTAPCPICNGTGFVDTEITLSVCMIVGKEEANLQRCLDSILPITFQHWCELIIICTQKGDRTEEVARQYADYVEFQEWKNDFSYHRNYGISLAKGQKIFIIDADEQLEQDSLYLFQEMINNPEYSEFGTMFVNVINFISKDKKSSSDVQQPRIFDNPKGEPLYTGTSHNKAKTTEPYFIADNVNLFHYGYMFEGKEDLKKQKLDRSLPLLLEEFKKDKNNLQAITHLVKTYHIEGMHKETMQYGKRWIKLMRQVKKKGDYGDGYSSYDEIWNILVASCITVGKIRKALKYKKISEEFTTRLPMIHFHIGYYYATKNNEEEALKYMENGVRISNTVEGVMEGCTASHVDMIIDEIFVWLARHYFAKGDYDKAGKYFNAGVHHSKNPQRLRWDLWNETECKKRLIAG